MNFCVSWSMENVKKNNPKWGRDGLPPTHLDLVDIWARIFILNIFMF